MSDEKLVINKSTLTAIADAVRNKTGGTDSILVSNLADNIASIQAGSNEPTLDMIVGEFTPQTNLTEYDVSITGKSNSPIIALCYAENIGATSTYMHKVSIGIKQSDDYLSSSSAMNDYQGGYGGLQNYAGVTVCESTQVKFTTRGGKYYFKTAYTYRYILLFE